jgi:predicted choloylglycine hydrolase
VELSFKAIAEPWPGPRWRARFETTWPAYRDWYLRDGDAARPSFAEARERLQRHVPELVPAWTRLVELAGGGDVAARMLSLYGTPPLVTGCSQAALPGPVLARNYDFHPALFEGVIALTQLGRRRVIGMSDCLWGLLDGMNDSGLAVSLAFGGRRATGPGFAAPLIVRYLLETCDTTAEAIAALQRVPVQVSYNLTILDASGAAATARIAPDRPVALAPHPVAANHQGHVEWSEHATAFRSVEREAKLLELLEDPDVNAFLEAPLLNGDYEHGFGTLYTAIHRPAGGTIEYRWPGEQWIQSFGAFAEGERAVMVQSRFSV